jgi:hypothetical protein
MKTTVGKHLAVLSMLGFLTACAQMGPHEAENATVRKAAESARTYADHDRLAQRYQSAARELRVKAEEQKKLLQHYEEKSYLYGRQAQDHQSHTSALLNKYQQAAAETIKQAAFHHRIAAELAKGDHAARLSNRESKARIEANPEDWSGNSGKAL